MRTLSLLAALLLCTPSLLAQYTIGKIVFSNPGPYAERDLLTIAAIKSGDPISKPDLQTVATRLSDSGYFEDVQAYLVGPVKTVEVHINLKPVAPTKLLPPIYDNFVWFTPGELAATLNKTLPLLSHGVPEGGTQQAQVRAAIEHLLADRSITATTSSQVAEPTTFHPGRFMDFTTDTPRVLVRKVSLNGASPELVPALKAMLTRIAGTRFNEGSSGITTADLLLEPYLNAGYVEAKLSNLQRTIVPEASTPTRTLVDLQATIQSGSAYTLSTITFAGTPLVTPESFTSTLKLKPQSPASRKQLKESLLPITTAYHAKGYMDALIDTNPALDTTAHTVAYTITVTPGDQYHLKSLETKDMPPSVRADFDKVFRLHPGDVYDESYVATFFKQNTSVKSLQPYYGTYSSSADPDTHLIDLTITFLKQEITVH